MHNSIKASVEAGGAKRSSSLIGDDIAIRLSDVKKEYKLYDSFSDQALDVLGVSWLRFWRRLNYKTFSALNGVNLEIKKGERVGVIGRNGAGKTTLLKLITGNFAPTSGKIEVNGNVQALMQTGLGFHGEFTGLENIRSALAYSGLPTSELDAAIDDIVSFCELGDFLNQPMKSYSLGMRARLQFAVSTAIKPDIVIIDEVLGAGDAYFASRSAERVRRLTDSGATLLIVSHSMSQILQFANKALWIDGGQILTSGDPLTVVNQYEEHIMRMNKDAEKNASLSTNGQLPKSSAGGSRWGGEGPLRIGSSYITNSDGLVIDHFSTGEAVRLVAEVCCEDELSHSCSCLFVLYDDVGNLVCQVVQPEQDYQLPSGGIKKVEFWLDTNPIGEGRYFLSCGLYKNFDLACPENALRYDILSRAQCVSVRSSTRDKSKIVLTGQWIDNQN